MHLVRKFLQPQLLSGCLYLSFHRRSCRFMCCRHEALSISRKMSSGSCLCSLICSWHLRKLWLRLFRSSNQQQFFKSVKNVFLCAKTVTLLREPTGAFEIYVCNVSSNVYWHFSLFEIWSFVAITHFNRMSYSYELCRNSFICCMIKLFCVETVRKHWNGHGEVCKSTLGTPPSTIQKILEGYALDPSLHCVETEPHVVQTSFKLAYIAGTEHDC